MEDEYYYYEKDDYGTHYGEYAGTYAQDVAGYSDDVINDAFDGEPDAYWNIDYQHSRIKRTFSSQIIRKFATEKDIDIVG